MVEESKQYDQSAVQSISLFKSQQTDTIKWMLDFSPELKELERDLSGIKRVNGKDVEIPNGRKLSEKGVNEIITKLRMILGKIPVLSNMDERQIYDDAKNWTFYFTNECYYNHDEWGFRSYSERSALINTISALYLKLLLRAKGALQLRQLGETVQRQERVVYGDRQQQGKWYEFWRGK